MILSLPQEIICMIAKECSLSEQATLARTCHLMYGICNTTLYRNDIENHDSSSVFYAIVWCFSEAITMNTLALAKAGGAKFRVCRDMCKQHTWFIYDAQTTLHSPIHLAARRGLDCVVSFLIEEGISPDGPPGVYRTPLMEAIFNRRELTSILLVHRGASTSFQQLQFDALSSAIQHDLPLLTRFIVESKALDVNANIGYGTTALDLAVRHRKSRVVPVLLSLGADGAAATLRFCRSHAFASLSWLLEAGSSTLRNSLRLQDLLDLTVNVVLQRVSPTQKNSQVVLLGRLIDMINWARLGETRMSKDDLKYFLDVLLHSVVSLTRAERPLALLLLRRGARIWAGSLMQLLGIFNSSAFIRNTGRCVRRHPRILESFDIIYTYYSTLPPQERVLVEDYFIDSVPDHVIRLMHDLKLNELPLTVGGVRGLEALERTQPAADAVPISMS